MAKPIKDVALENFEPGSPEYNVYLWHTEFGISTADLAIILKTDIRFVREIVKRERDIRGDLLARYDRWFPAISYAIDLDLLPMTPRSKTLNILALCDKAQQAIEL